MKAFRQYLYCPVELLIILYKAVLTKSVVEVLMFTIKIEATKQYLSLVLFIML